MKLIPISCGIVLAQAITFGATIAAHAAPKDYEFKLVETELHQGSGAKITVNLINTRTNTPVKNAVIFTTRLDMAPEGMEGMTSPIVALGSDARGLYRFQTDLPMAGEWRFQIAAKVQGETETVQGELTIGVLK